MLVAHNLCCCQLSSTQQQAEVHPGLCFDDLLAFGESPSSLTLVRSLRRQVYGTKVQMVLVQRQSAHLLVGLPVVRGHSRMTAEAGCQSLCNV